MDQSEIASTCDDCRHKFSGIPKKSFLGFQKMSCPACKKQITLPLVQGYRITYWVLLVLMIFGFFNAISEGGVAVPGGFGIAIIVALLIDSKLKSKANDLKINDH
jgi:hypothetical protein